MSESEGPARPRQLTMAAGFVIGGSVFLVLSVFDTFTTLNSVEMRDEITKVLSSPTGEGLGLSLSEAKAFMRVGLMIAAACAAAAAVLGVYALQRHRAARVALSVLAVPILLTAPLTGGLMGALVAAATLMLWSGPARDWFAGRPVRQAGPQPPKSSSGGAWETTMPSPEDRHRTQGQPPEAPPTPTPASPPPGGTSAGAPPPASELSTTGSSTAPVPTTGFGERRPDPAAPQAAAWVPPTYDEVTRGSAVPVTVKIACFLTWGFSGVVALLYAAMLLALIVAQDRIVDLVLDSPGWQRADLDADLLVPVLWVGCLMFLGWSVGACVLAWFAWRRHNWARWMLAASAATTIVAAIFAFPVGVLHQLAAAVAIAGLFSAASRTWYARQPRIPGGPGGPPGGEPGDPMGAPTDWRTAPPPTTDQYPAAPPPPGPYEGKPPPPSGKPPVW